MHDNIKLWSFNLATAVGLQRWGGPEFRTSSKQIHQTVSVLNSHIITVLISANAQSVNIGLQATVQLLTLHRAH